MENLWEMIAKARGVAIDEVFKWQGSNYKITNYEGLLVLEYGWVRSNSVVSFIKGEGKIEKIPFVPKVGEKYWTYSSDFTLPVIEYYSWSNSCYDKERKLLGIIFKTKQDAKDYLPTWEKRLEGEE